MQLATSVVGDLGLVGIFLLMLAESACIPIPSEATMLFAGFGVSQGRYTLLAITVAGVLGNLVGSWLSYGVGYFGRIELVERHAGKLHIKPQHLAWADRWFARYGTATVFFTRMLPIIRTFISLPAGVARMPFVRLTVFTLLGCIPWVFLLGFVGDQVGHNWTQWKDNLQYVDYVVIAAVLGAVAYLTVRWLAGRRATRPSSRAGGERHVQATQEDSTDPEHDSYVSRGSGQPRIAVLAPVARADHGDHRDGTEAPRQREGERNQRGGDPEPAQDAAQRRAAAAREKRSSLDGDPQSPSGGRTEPLP